MLDMLDCNQGHEGHEVYDLEVSPFSLEESNDGYRGRKPGKQVRYLKDLCENRGKHERVTSEGIWRMSIFFMFWAIWGPQDAGKSGL